MMAAVHGKGRGRESRGTTVLPEVACLHFNKEESKLLYK